MHRMVTQRTLLGVLGTALISGSAFAAGPFLDELPTVVISDQMNKTDVANNPTLPYDPFTAPTRNIYRFTDSFVLADFVFFQDNSTAAKETVVYNFLEWEDNGSELVPVADGSQTITINGAAGDQAFGGTLGDFNFGSDPDVVSAGALDYVDTFYTGPDPNNPTNPQGLSDVEGATPFLKRSYIQWFMASPNGLDVATDIQEVITTNSPVFDPDMDMFVRYDFATTGPIDTGFLTCELVLDELSNWSFVAGNLITDYSVVPNNPIAVYGTPAYEPPTTTAALTNGLTDAGTMAIDISVDGSAPNQVSTSAGFSTALWSPQVALVSSYNGSTAALPNALPGASVSADTVYVARATISNTAQDTANVARIANVRTRLGEAGVVGLGEAESNLALGSANHIASATTRVHRTYFYALGDGTGSTYGPDIADRNLSFSIDVLDLFTDLLTDGVTIELSKVDILSFELSDLGSPTVVLNQGGEVGVDYNLAAGVQAPPAGAVPFSANWTFSSLIDSFPAIAAERVATGAANPSSLSIDYQAGNGTTVAAWAGETVAGISNDSLIVAEYYVSTTNMTPDNRGSARVLLNAAAEGRLELFNFFMNSTDAFDAQTDFSGPTPTGLAPGDVTGLEAAAKRVVVIMDPQKVAGGTVDVGLAAEVVLFDAFSIADTTVNPPVDLSFFLPGAANGNLTVNGVVVSTYPLSPDIAAFECP